jgi:uroporphyrinogen decarboxylase
MEHGLPVYFFSRSPFTLAANICSLEQFCRWMMKKPELCERLMRMAIEHIFNVLGYWVETFGPEKIFAWMSSPSESNQVISPRHMEKIALPYHIEYHERLRKLGIRRFGLHICGEQNRNLGFLAEASPWPHPSVLSFGHEVDLEVAGKTFPEDIIYGNIEPSVIQTGTPEKVYELSRIAIEKGKKAPGGFILGPGCGLPPTAPPVKVYAMTRAVHDFGWYD